MQRFFFITGFILILVGLEFFAKSIKSNSKRNGPKIILKKAKLKIQNIIRHFSGKRELKVAVKKFNLHDKFTIYMSLGLLLTFQGLLFGYDPSGGLASILEVSDNSLFKRKFSQTYEAANYPTRISDVVYKINFEAESHHVSTPEQLGKIVLDGMASAGAAMYADSQLSEQGLLAKTTTNNVQPKGEYIANFNLKIPRSATGNEFVAVLEVFDTQLNKYLAQKEIRTSDFKTPGAYQNFEVPFEKQEMGNTQYRVLITGKTPLWLDKISIDPQFDNWVIYDPKIYFDNVRDELAIAPLVRQGAALRDLRGHISKIQLKEGLASGTYTATFRIKTKNKNVEHPIAKVEVHDRGRQVKYYSRSISADDFMAENQYQEFDLEFEVTRLSKIELSVFFFDAPESDIYLDTVSIKNF